MSDEIPDDWTPLSEIEATSENKVGGVYLDTTKSGVSIIHYRKERENDVVSLYDFEVADLIHRLVDYQDCKL
jgi:hypothetical protein